MIYLLCMSRLTHLQNLRLYKRLLFWHYLICVHFFCCIQLINLMDILVCSLCKLKFLVAIFKEVISFLSTISYIYIKRFFTFFHSLMSFLFYDSFLNPKIGELPQLLKIRNCWEWCFWNGYDMLNLSYFTNIPFYR